MIYVSRETLQALVDAGIVVIAGWQNGDPVSVELAFEAPGLCRVYANSGNVYELERAGEGRLAFVPETIVYSVGEEL